MLGLKGTLKPSSNLHHVLVATHQIRVTIALSKLAWSTSKRAQLALYSTQFITSTSVQVYPTRENKATPSARLGEANLAAARGIEVTFFCSHNTTASHRWGQFPLAFVLLDSMKHSWAAATHLPAAGTGTFRDSLAAGFKQTKGNAFSHQTQVGGGTQCQQIQPTFLPLLGCESTDLLLLTLLLLFQSPFGTDLMEMSNLLPLPSCSVLVAFSPYLLMYVHEKGCKDRLESVLLI